MPLSKSDILQQLQQDILPLQGYKPMPSGRSFDAGLGPIRFAFPNANFPVGAIHEFHCSSREDAAATTGFLSGMLSFFMKQSGIVVWICLQRTLYPPALSSFGIQPDHIIFFELRNEKDLLWTAEESLKCEGLAAVVCEVRGLSFMVSRRLQLAVEQSRVTGFLLRHQQRISTTSASVSRWKISHAPSTLPEGMSGVGFPRWQVDLVKVRNGKPGSWLLEWNQGRFRQVDYAADVIEIRKKTG
jgi:protein ImuA